MGKKRSELTANYPLRTMTIDPGFGGTGWAYWLGNAYPIYGVIKEKAGIKKGTDEIRITLMVREFRNILKYYQPTRVVLESMQLWQSLMSQTSAARGDLFLLQTLVGAYASTCIFQDIEFEFRTPTQWKGQLSKEALRARISMINACRYPDHAEDAVGIGFHLAGIL